MRMDQFKTWSVPKASLFPAILLGALVLFTYSTLQNYGPESTLRKFHTAIREINQSQLAGKGIPKSDWNDLRATLSEDLGEIDGTTDPQTKEILQRVTLLMEAGYTYSLARMDRRFPREVRIAVVYQKGKLPPTSMVWVVDKPSGGREWKISARKTLSAMTVP